MKQFIREKHFYDRKNRILLSIKYFVLISPSPLFLVIWYMKGSKKYGPNSNEIFVQTH